MNEENIHRHAMRSLPGIAVVAFDLNFRYILAEGLSLCDHDISELMIGKTLDQTLPPESVKTLKPLYERAVQGEHFEYELRGTTGYFFCHFQPLTVDNGSIVGGFILIQDITTTKESELRALKANKEMKKAQHILLQSEKLSSLSVLASSLTHEINNPLAIIKRHYRNRFGRTNQRPFKNSLSEYMNSAIDRIVNVVKHLDYYTHRPASQVYQTISVEELLERNLILLQNYIASNDIRLEKFFGTTENKLVCDPLLMEIAFQNLIRLSIEGATSLLKEVNVSVMFLANQDRSII